MIGSGDMSGEELAVLSLCRMPSIAIATARDMYDKDGRVTCTWTSTTPRLGASRISHGLTHPFTPYTILIDG